MYPDDRVLVVFVPTPIDFKIIQQDSWYRIPQKSAPKGFISEYFAFYFGRPFGEKKWAIHYYAPRLGYELTYRRDLFPNEQRHPRANELYYKVQLGPIVQLAQPIISLKWRRITFLHTTMDRFLDAREINDLFIEGDDYVDRKFTTLRDRDPPQ